MNRRQFLQLTAGSLAASAIVPSLEAKQSTRQLPNFSVIVGEYINRLINEHKRPQFKNAPADLRDCEETVSGLLNEHRLDRVVLDYDPMGGYLNRINEPILAAIRGEKVFGIDCTDCAIIIPLYYYYLCGTVRQELRRHYFGYDSDPECIIASERVIGDKGTYAIWRLSCTEMKNPIFIVSAYLEHALRPTILARFPSLQSCSSITSRVFGCNNYSGHAWSSIRFS